MARVPSTCLLTLIAVLGTVSLRAADDPSTVPPAHARQAGDVQPLSWLKSGKYAVLQDYYSQQQQRYEAGSLSDEQLYASVRQLYENSTDNEGFFDRWVEAYPSSYVAVLSRGVYLYRMAWAARGEKFIRDTPTGQIEAMKNYLSRAQPDLLSSLKLTAKPYLSALYLLNVAMLQGTASERRRWYEQGMAIDPDNVLIRYRYMFSLRPRWGGSYEQMQEFLRKCEAQHAPAALLARLNMLIHADLAEDAMSGADTQKTFDEWQRVLDLAPAAGEEPSTEALIGFTRAAQDLNRPTDVQRGLKLLEGRDPKDAWSAGRLGWIYVQAHEDEKAWPLLVRAAEQNDPWAQFVVGKGSFDGLPALHKAPNQQAGLPWIRASAAQCFPDAVRFLAARGEKPSAECKRRSNGGREWWAALIPAAGALLTSLVTAWAAASRKRAQAAAAPARMQYPAITGIIGVLVLGALLILAAFVATAGNGAGRPVVAGVFAAFGALGLLLILESVRVWHVLTADGLEFGRLLGPRGSLRWRDVTRLTYSKEMRWFRIETASGEVARISAILTGLPEFARAVLEQVPTYAIDDSARGVLQARAQGPLPRLAS